MTKITLILIAVSLLRATPPTLRELPPTPSSPVDDRTNLIYRPLPPQKGVSTIII